jgi:phosphoribosylamine--glycine ligase
MLTERGPRVIEYNVRFGDPECQVLMCRLKSDIVPILLATARGKLEDIETPEWDERACVGVVAAAEGYPQSPRKGDRITGIDAAHAIDDVVVFHGGTKLKRTLDGEEEILTNGGRVLTVTAMGADTEAARTSAYEAYDRIAFAGKFCRTDIGRRHDVGNQTPAGA